MLNDLIAKYLADSISREEYLELYSKLKADSESRRIFAEHKNNWTIVGLILEWEKRTSKGLNRRKEND